MITPLSDQQKLILTILAQQNGYRHYADLAKENKLKPGSFLTQLNGKLKPLDLVKNEHEGSPNWVITEAGIAALQRMKEKPLPTPEEKLEELFAETPPPPPPPKHSQAPPLSKVEEHPRDSLLQSREALGLSEFQIFQKIGQDMGGLTDAKVRGIADVVFGDDPYNLDRVWANLSEMNVAIDLRKQWFKLWQTYLAGSGKPADISPNIQAQLTPADKRTPEQIKAMEEQGRDWDLIEDDQGLLEPERVGGGIGEYTLKEAKEIMALRNRARRQLTATHPPQPPQEPISQLITALLPLLKPDADQTVVKWLIEEKLGAISKTVADSVPKGQGIGDFFTNLPKYAEMLKTLAPILRAALGVPDVQIQPQTQSQNTPIQLLNTDGKPFQMNLGDFITIQKFQAEQKREDESAKGKQEFMGTVRSFVDRIGKAAERAAGGK